MASDTSVIMSQCDDDTATVVALSTWLLKTVLPPTVTMCAVDLCKATTITAPLHMDNTVHTITGSDEEGPVIVTVVWQPVRWTLALRWLLRLAVTAATVGLNPSTNANECVITAVEKNVLPETPSLGTTAAVCSAVEAARRAVDIQWRCRCTKSKNSGCGQDVFILTDDDAKNDAASSWTRSIVNMELSSVNSMCFMNACSQNNKYEDKNTHEDTRKPHYCAICRSLSVWQ